MELLGKFSKEQASFNGDHCVFRLEVVFRELVLPLKVNQLTLWSFDCWARELPVVSPDGRGGEIPRIFCLISLVPTSYLGSPFFVPSGPMTIERRPRQPIIRGWATNGTLKALSQSSLSHPQPVVHCA